MNGIQQVTGRVWLASRGGQPCRPMLRHVGFFMWMACILMPGHANASAGIAQPDVAGESRAPAALFGSRQDNRLAWAYSVQLLYRAEKAHRLLGKPVFSGDNDEREIASALQDMRSISRALDMESVGACYKQAIAAHVRQIDASARYIVARKGKRTSLHTAVAEFQRQAPIIQTMIEKLVDTMIEEAADHDQLAIMQRQSWLAERVARHSTAIGNGEEELVVHVDVLGRDLHLMKRVVTGQLNGDKALYISRIKNLESRKLLVELDGIMDRLLNLRSRNMDTFPVEMQVRHDLDQLAKDIDAIEKSSECLAGDAS